MATSLRQGDIRSLGAASALLVAVGLAIGGIAPFIAEASARSGAESFGTALLALGCGAALLLLLRVEPAWPLSLGMAAMIFSSNWHLLGSPIAIDRVLILTGLCSLIGRARSPRDVLGREPSGVHLLLIFASLYAVTSAVMAGTIEDRETIFSLLGGYGLPFALFAVAPAAFPDARARRILLGTLTVVGAYLAYTSILGWLGPKALVIPGYITDPHVGLHADRARGPFIEAAANGLGLFACGVAAALLYAGETDRRVRFAAAAVVGACALSVVLTVTRSVWLGSAVALVVTLLATRESRRYFVPALVAGVFLVIAAFAVIPGLQREADERTSEQKPIWDRKNANNAALRMVEARPLLGFGFHTFEERSSDYILLGGDYPVTRSDVAEHNVFLNNAAELGLIGFTLWGGALAWAVGGAILRRGPPELYWWKIGLLAIATQWFVIANFVPLGYAFPNALLWLWAGVAWVPRSSTEPSRRELRALSA